MLTRTFKPARNIIDTGYGENYASFAPFTQAQMDYPLEQVIRDIIKSWAFCVGDIDFIEVLDDTPGHIVFRKSKNSFRGTCGGNGWIGEFVVENKYGEKDNWKYIRSPVLGAGFTGIGQTFVGTYMHELGHCLGLDHIGWGVMNYASDFRAVLQEWDILEAIRIHGPPRTNYTKLELARFRGYMLDRYQNVKYGSAKFKEWVDIWFFYNFRTDQAWTDEPRPTVSDIMAKPYKPDESFYFPTIPSTDKRAILEELQKNLDTAQTERANFVKSLDASRNQIIDAIGRLRNTGVPADLMKTLDALRLKMVEVRQKMIEQRDLIKKAQQNKVFSAD